MDLELVAAIVLWGSTILFLFAASVICARWSRYKYTVVVFGLALLLRVLWVAYAPAEPTSDFLFYHLSAKGLAEGRGYAGGGVPTAFWPVGYPAFLATLYALFGPHPVVGQLANALLGTTSVVLTFVLARELFDEQIARTAGLVMALFPGQIYYSATLSSEMLSQVCFVLVLLCAVKHPLDRLFSPWLLPLGVVLGLGMLTRSAMVVALPAAAAWWLLRGATWRQTVLAGTIATTLAAVVVTPWIVRNYLIFGVFVPGSTNGGINLLQANNPLATGGYVDADVVVEAEFGGYSGFRDEVDFDRQARSRAIEYIRNNPRRVLSMVVRKPYTIWSRDDEGLWYSFVLPDGMGISIPYWIYSGWRMPALAYLRAVLLLAALAVVFVVSRRPWAPRTAPLAMALLTALLVTAFHLPFTASGRYNHMAIPCVCLAAGAALAALARRMRLDPA